MGGTPALKPAVNREGKGLRGEGAEGPSRPSTEHSGCLGGHVVSGLGLRTYISQVPEACLQSKF